MVFKFRRRKKVPVSSTENDSILMTDAARRHIDYYLEVFARRESRNKLVIEREILYEGIVARILKNVREDSKALRRSGHHC